jgi:anti-sigma regulatory factor (Ser/Thr protein kinase)
VAWDFSSGVAEDALKARDEFVTALHRQMNRPIDDFVAKLIFTELVGNVIRHAPGPIRISLELDGDEHWLHVFDRGPAFEWRSALPDDPYVGGGRGLFLISLYAEEVIVERPAAGGNGVHIKLKPALSMEAPVAYKSFVA